MPDTMSVSVGVSFGLLAGIVSGVCYIMANGIPWQSDDDQRRLTDSKSTKGVCRRCGGDQQGDFLPCVCVTQEPVKFEKGAWFLRQIQKAITLMPWSFSTDKLEQIAEECESNESPEERKIQGDLKCVREFLETLSAKLAGGTLEGIRVAPLYDHPQYLPQRHEQAGASNPSAPRGATSAHSQLKRLVARVVEEAAALPALARYAADPPRAPSIEDSTYEDLLATAILNKVIERYQTENGSGGRSSGIHSASASPTPSERSSPRSLSCRHNRDITPTLLEQDEEEPSDWEEGEATDDALEIPRRVPFPEFGGDIIHGVEDGAGDYDEVSGSDIQAVDGSWEENWLFQKKKIKSIHSVPVPMLVPNSNLDIKAMIGDREADDTSDLSDNASDDEDNGYKSDIKLVLDSKHVIGGKTKLDNIEILDFEPDSLTIIDDIKSFDEVDNVNDVASKNISKNETVNDHISSIQEEEDGVVFYSVNSGPIPKAEFNLKEEIHRKFINDANIDVIDVTENSEDKDRSEYQKNELTQSGVSGHEREGEYEETVAVPVQRYADSLRRKHFHDEPQTIPTRDTDKEEDLLPGSVAYRERKKWLNYVEMPNNPYSPEAIQKRLSAKSTSSIFDMITKGIDTKDLTEDNRSQSVVDIVESYIDETPEGEEEVNDKFHSTPVLNESRSKNASPKILKDVLAEEMPQYKRYGRDYYIQEAKMSTGSRKRGTFSDTSSISSMNKSMSLDNFDTEINSTEFLINQFNSIAKHQNYKDFAPCMQAHQSITIISEMNNSHNILIEYEDANEESLFSAKPVIIEDDTDKKFDEILESVYNGKKSENTSIVKINEEEPSSPKSVNSLDHSIISTSSTEDAIKIYNVQSGEIVKCKPVDNVSDSNIKVDSNENVDSSDKNSEEDISTAEESDVSMVIEEYVKENKLDVIEELEEITLPKVKELAKIFLEMENVKEVKFEPEVRRRKSRDNILSLETPVNKQTYMHSLTARSISKKFREELKQSMATPLKFPGGANEVPEGTEEVIKESSRPGSPLPEPGTIKTKLAFFESLKAKFNNK